jgi:chromosome segregation ATPase
MADVKLHEEVEAVVNQIMKNNEEAKIRKEIEDALQASADRIKELSKFLEDNETEMEEAKEKIVVLNATIDELKSTIENMEKEAKKFGEEKASFDGEKEKLTVELEAAKTELDSMKKDRIASDRMIELEKSGVIAKDKDGQKNKIKEMSDDEFASYKADLISVKESIIAELEEGKGDSDDVTLDNSMQTATLNLAQASQAALNMELIVGKDLANKYTELGKAMAERIAKNK